MSLEGVMSNTVRIEATVINMELAAKYRPGHILFQCDF